MFSGRYTKCAVSESLNNWAEFRFVHIDFGTVSKTNGPLQRQPCNLTVAEDIIMFFFVFSSVEENFASWMTLNSISLSFEIRHTLLLEMPTGGNFWIKRAIHPCKLNHVFIYKFC